ncbi:SpoIIE family protein phosphatase [Actinomadura madurae]|uniref:SpoIIE family protein phosphatase n=1 Tax=Actinomadura madurae TaxID=1993 RepID=UPI0020264346|nr:SpoIIE family protein phosphatase [Actinomadura madurae]URN06123.1 SpoIIE family protein phosphatase [Actinomadura madurae]
MHDPDDEEAFAQRTGDARTVREVFETAPVPLVGLGTPDHTVVAANAAYRRFVGRQDVLGRRMRDVLPEIVGQQLLGAFDRPLATGEAEPISEWRVQLGRGEDGERGEIYIDGVILPRRAPDGSVIGLVAHVQDVTERVLERRSGRRQAGRHDPADVLRRHLLPAGLPILPGLQIGGVHLPAGSGDAASGDWFDAVPLPDGRTALVTGDVAGHGAAAAAAMGRLRTVLEDRLDSSGDIGEALAAADRLAVRSDAARAATVCVAAVDPADGRLTYCTAGHPPPLLIPSGGQARYVPSTGGGPLGTGSRFPLAEARLGLGDHLLLYTNGIIDRPGVGPAGGTVELARTATDVAAGRAMREEWLAPVDRLTTQTLELLVRVSGHSDDIALLAAQRTLPPSPLLLEMPAGTEAVPAVRKALDDWLHDLGTRAEDVILLRHAVGELVGNVVEHAYASPPGTVRVRAECTGRGSVEVEVADDGRWREHVPDLEVERGRGLAMATDFVGHLRIETEPSGTTATVLHRLTRPVRLLSAGEITPPAAPPPDVPELLLIFEQPSEEAAPRIRVDGPVDAATAGQLREELQMRTRGGTAALTVDLTGVTHLGSAGVAVLHEARAHTDALGRPLLLYAPAGSPAQHVMSQAALPHTTTDPG